LATEEAAATVFFLTTVGASLTIEDIRQEARNGLLRGAEKAARRNFPTQSRTDAAVTAMALIVVCEVAARAQLSRDETYRTLGPRRFREEIVGLVESVANL
jgi:hypothetical protein